MQTFQTYFCIQTNSLVPDQTGPEEQSDLGPHCLQKLLLKSQADDKADDYCCDWQLKGKVNSLSHFFKKLNIPIWLPVVESKHC